MAWLFNESKLGWFLLLAGATLCFTWLQQTFFVSDILYYNTYGDQLSMDTVEMIIGSAKKWAWVSYLFTPLLLLLRVTFVACCFYTALFFRNEKTDFSSCFNISLKSDTVFLLFGLFGIVYQLFFPASNLSELSSNPTTLLYYIEIENIPKYLLYPLGLVNLSELLYWGLLVSLVRYRFGCSLSNSFSFVIQSYGIGLMLIILIFSIILI
jgi:hypothetical protein